MTVCPLRYMMDNTNYLLDKDKNPSRQKMVYSFIENHQAFQELLNYTTN